MQLVRHLFSYSIVVVVVVMIASGYYYRETLFPNLFPQAGESLTAGETTAEKTTTESTTEKPVAADQPMPGHIETEREDMAMSPAEAEPVPEPQVAKPAVTPEPPAAPLKQTEATNQPIPAKQTTQDAQSTADQAPPTEMLTATIRQPQGSDSAPHPEPTEPRHTAMPMHEQPAPVPPAPAVATQRPGTEAGSVSLSQQMQLTDSERRDIETIMIARRAYWAGDYDASEQAYQQLIDRHPDEAELHGEVGNVYYAQGKWAKAAAAYAQVVRQLYRTGRIAQADYMLQIVTSLDSELGKQLQREQDSTTGQQ